MGIPTSHYPRPPELQALATGRAAVVEASAGTGKTFILEHLVVDLILNGIPVEELVVVTFTEKATAELRRRVREKLQEVLSHQDAAVTAAPQPALGIAVWKVNDEARSRLQTAISALDRATITTIHGFCNRLLSEHAFANGRPLVQELTEGKKLFTEMFRESLRRDIASSPALQPWLEAWLDTHQNGGIERLSELLYEGYQVGTRTKMGPPFDAAALGLVLNRLATFDTRDLEADLKAAGLHSSTNKAIRTRLSNFINLAAPSQGSATLPQFIVAYQSLAKEDPVAFVRDKLASKAATAALAPLSSLMSDLDQALVPLSAIVMQEFLPLVRARLDKQKRKTGALDFDDMLNLVANALDGPGGDALAATLQRKYQAALIDEFQDTDEVQWRIFERLFLAPGTSHRLYLIGDPKQAIYSFRGADVQTYLRARDLVLAGQGAVVPLAQNFRSSEALITALNLIFAQDAKPDPFFSGAIHYDHPVSCGLVGRRILNAAHTPLRPLVLLAIPPNHKGKLVAAPTKKAIAATIAKQIRALIDQPPLVEDGRPGVAPRPLRPNDIFVLTRSLAEGLEAGEALRTLRIPHAYFKQDGLMETDEARAVQSLLLAIACPDSRSARLKAFLTPFFDLDLRTLENLERTGADAPLQDQLRAWRSLADQGDYARFFSSIIDTSGLVRRQLSRGDTERSVTNVLHLFELLLQDLRGGHPTVQELCLRLAIWRDERGTSDADANVQRLETDKQSVQLLTMHKSKGLEAQVVFLFGGLFPFHGSSVVNTHHLNTERCAHVGTPRDPTIKAAITQAHAEEDQRVLYVALTRAKTRLYLPYSGRLDSDVGPLEDNPAADTATFAEIQGPYGSVNRRLRVLVQAPVFRDLIDVIPVDTAPLSKPAHAAPTATNAPSPTTPLPLSKLRRGHMGTVITSYSQIKRIGDDSASDDDPTAADDVDEFSPSLEFHDLDEPPSPGGDDELVLDLLPDAEVIATSPPVAPATDTALDLPPGAATGILLHELIERIPLASLLGVPSFDLWVARPDVTAVIHPRVAMSTVGARHIEACAKLVYAALTTPLSPAPALCSLERPFSRETELLFPIPGARSPSFIKGILDGVFAHEGRLYGLDWKSDRIPDVPLRAHVDEHYGLQLRLYTIGLIRLLGIADEGAHEALFGGFFYIFLRKQPLGDGVVFLRPSFADVQGWQNALPHDPNLIRLAMA